MVDYCFQQQVYLTLILVYGSAKKTPKTAYFLGKINLIWHIFDKNLNWSLHD